MNVYISMPMNGKSKEDIEARRTEIEQLMIKRFPNDKINIIDSIYRGEKKGPVWCLGYSVSMMNDADLVVFDKGWRNARGCKIEYDVCAYYGFRFMEL